MAIAVVKLSFEEYLTLERSATVRHEFVDGQLIAMAGEKRSHNRRVRRLVVLLEAIANKKGCEIVAENVKVRNRKSRVRYPDFAVSCSPGNDEYFLDKPCFIAEVLSDSTKNTDFAAKLSEYTGLKSLERYVILDPIKPFAVLYKRVGNRWEVETFEDQGNIDIPSLGTELSLEQIYAKP